jgi:hypothetical protein
MIVSRKLYEDSIEKIFSLNLNENTEAMTHQYEQQNLCPYHREKYRRHKNDKIHRNKLNHNYSDKYVCKKRSIHTDRSNYFISPSVTQQENNNIVRLCISYFYNSLYLSISIVKLFLQRHHIFVFYSFCYTSRT